MNTSSRDQSTTAVAAQGTSSLAPRETHTPGPWEYVNVERGGHHFRFIRAPNTIVENDRGPSYAREVFSDEDYPEKDADGALIAAAPDLLDAAQLLMTWFNITGASVNARWDRIPPQERLAILNAMRAAIRKALSDGSEADATR